MIPLFSHPPAILSAFSGYAGLDLGVTALLGGYVIAHIDNDPAAAAVLAHHWPHTPNLGDITQVDWHQVAATWPIDILTGGFPCQDVSAAGRRAGLAPDTRSGLWAHLRRAIHILRPRLVVIENVRGLLSAPAHRDVEPEPDVLGDRHAQPVLRAAGAVLGDLATLGYDARWCGLRAADIGAPHARYRVFIAARDTAGQGRREGQTRRRVQPTESGPGCVAAADPDRLRRQRSRHPRGRGRGPAHHDRLTARPDGGRRGSIEPGDGARESHLAWGDYAPAIHRWERLLGRPAPEPTEPGRAGKPVLSPAFVEWLMGLPADHVTAVPGLSRNAQLRLLGNGVVPQQATTALHRLTGLTAPHYLEVGA